MFEHNFDPYEILIDAHNRTISHDQILQQLQQNIVQMSNVLNHQAQVIKNQARMNQILAQRLDLQEQMIRSK